MALKVYRNFEGDGLWEGRERVVGELIKAAGDEARRVMTGGGTWKERIERAEEIAGVAKGVLDAIPEGRGDLRNVVVCNSMIRTFGEAHMVRSAFEVYERMKEEGVEPTMVTFGSLSAACEREGDAGRVDVVFDEMNRVGLKPNEFVYGSAIGAFKKKGKWRRAVNFLGKMTRDEGQVVLADTFNVVLALCLENRETEELLKVWKVMRERAMKEDANAGGNTCRPNLQTFKTVIGALCEAKQPNQAVNVITEMDKWEVECTTEVKLDEQRLERSDERSDSSISPTTIANNLLLVALLIADVHPGSHELRKGEAVQERAQGIRDDERRGGQILRDWGTGQRAQEGTQGC